MKNILLFLLVSSCITTSNAQLLDRVRNKLEQKAGEKIDQSIDKATQKKKPKQSEAPKETSSGQSSTTETPASSGSDQVQQNSSPKSVSIQDINSYSKFDFIAGEKIIVHEDFSQEALGDFPTKWNTRSSAEVVTINNRDGKWLSAVSGCR